MKILVVDDEELALNRLKRILNELGYECDTIDNPIEIDFSVHYDIYFLDINMPHFSGLEIAKKITQTNSGAFVIFQTAYENHALEAFEVGAIDYLLKPYTKEHIKNSLDRAKSYKKELDEIKIRTKNGNESYIINVDNIFYIEANLTEIMIRDKENFSYYGKKISDMEQLLSSKNFFRIHRSILINVDKIKNMQTVEQSKLEFSFNGIDDIITSSKDGAKKFREYISREQNQ